MFEPINIVFDGPPSHESGRFIEVENDAGASISVGEWIDRKNGLWSLRITELPSKGMSLLDVQKMLCDWMEKNHTKFQGYHELKAVLIKTINGFNLEGEDISSKKSTTPTDRLKNAVKELMDFANEHEQDLCSCEIGFTCQLHGALDSGKHALQDGGGK